MSSLSGFRMAIISVPGQRLLLTTLPPSAPVPTIGFGGFLRLHWGIRQLRISQYLDPGELGSWDNRRSMGYHNILFPLDPRAQGSRVFFNSCRRHVLTGKVVICSSLVLPIHVMLLFSFSPSVPSLIINPCPLFPVFAWQSSRFLVNDFC